MKKISIDFIILIIVSCVILIIGASCMYNGIKGLLNEHSLATESDHLNYVSSYSEFKKFREHGQSCYGIFNINTDFPVKNAEYNIPDTIYGKVTLDMKGNKSSKASEKLLWERASDTLLINDVPVDAKDIFTKLYSRAVIYSWDDADRNLMYMPIDCDYILAYFANKDVYYMTYNTDTSLSAMFHSRDDIDLYTRQLISGILQWLVVILLGIVVIRRAYRRVDKEEDIQ